MRQPLCELKCVQTEKCQPYLLANLPTGAFVFFVMEFNRGDMLFHLRQVGQLPEDHARQE